MAIAWKKRIAQVIGVSLLLDLLAVALLALGVLAK
jgi:hypothetical protein